MQAVSPMSFFAILFTITLYSLAERFPHQTAEPVKRLLTSAEGGTRRDNVPGSVTWVMQ
jgi:hypothetical protein